MLSWLQHKTFVCLPSLTVPTLIIQLPWFYDSTNATTNIDYCLTKSIGSVRFSLGRLILASLVFAFYKMHIGHCILVHCHEKDFDTEL